MLQVAGVHVPFGDAPGLREITLEVGRGERLAIVGPSGVGKTSLLRAVAGLAPVTAGAIRVDGREVTRDAPERRGAVYLHQSPTLFPHLDVFENVAFPLRIRRSAEAEVRTRVAEVLASVSLSGFEGRAPRTLSGGQRHRVALARAIAARPAVLLLDEPFAALDPSLRQEVRDAIVAVQERDRPALVLVTHDIDEAGLLGDRIGVLIDGAVVQIDTPRALFDRPVSLRVAQMLGFPNRVDGTLLDDGSFRSALGIIRPVPAPASTPTGPATAVFQPDAARPGPEGAPGRVIATRPRPRASTALVAVGELVLEVADDSAKLETGATVRVSVDPRRVTVLPADR